MLRRLQPTPARLLALLLAAEGAMFVCNWFRWTPKGYAVLLAKMGVGAGYSMRCDALGRSRGEVDWGFMR
jgi:hypothetical protein